MEHEVEVTSCKHRSHSVTGEEGKRVLQSSSNMSHPLPLFSFNPTSLCLSLSSPPTLCEITVTIVTQQIGLEVTVVVGAMATHICLCFALLLLSTCVGCTHTHTRRHTQRPHIVARNNSLLSKD